MKKNIFIIMLIALSIGIYSQPRQDTTWKPRLNAIENRLSDIDKKDYEVEIKSLKDKLDFQQKLNEQTISSISNQLESAAYNLTLFGVLFAIGAIGLGIYITYIERKIVKIGEENQELLRKSQKIKEDVEATNKLIQTDIYNLFLKIKREESVHILDRLIKVPKDIANVSRALLSRELHSDDFIKLKQAYMNLGEKDGYYKDQYNMLFFQHFLGHSLKDEDLRNVLSKYIPTGINSAFENDILKSTSDFGMALVDKGVHEYRNEINVFFEGLANSDYKNFPDVYKLLFDTLKSRKNRFDTFNIITSGPTNRVAKIEFGNLLLNQYSNESPTESEHLVFEEVKDLIAAQQKADEEAKQREEAKKKQEEERQRQQEERRRQQEEKRRALEEKQNQENKEKDN